ncbi:uncharacterized protein BDV14DRAFT_179451, partial [Aspergillus stella-maris]|uniref:uncharacterized protein n=1 Tax=Aspergillus stella-maris TaxID=1810926 RepID=UPI003CCDA536
MICSNARGMARLLILATMIAQFELVLAHLVHSKSQTTLRATARQWPSKMTS